MVAREVPRSRGIARVLSSLNPERMSAGVLPRTDVTVAVVVSLSEGTRLKMSLLWGRGAGAGLGGGGIEKVKRARALLYSRADGVTRGVPGG
jgi:hypothetical protein